MQALGRRYLPDQPLSCLVRVAPSMPGQNVEGDRWSAFLAPDLVTLFAETPWLDLPPNSEGQAELLAPLASIQPAQWQAVLAQLTAVSTEAPEPAPSPPQASPAGLPHGEQEARLFLLSVVNDPAAPLALRVEAAKALVQATAMSR